MHGRFFLFCLGLGLLTGLRAAEPQPAAAWDQAEVAPSKTSIYVGSVSLKPGVLTRTGTTLSAHYEVKVKPWVFWSETGQITLTVPELELANLARGERAEFTGTATNHKNKPREVSGYAQPTDATTGKIKVRIQADGFTLIFNSSYELKTTAPSGG